MCTCVQRYAEPRGDTGFFSVAIYVTPLIQGLILNLEVTRL